MTGTFPEDRYNIKYYHRIACKEVLYYRNYYYVIHYCKRMIKTSDKRGYAIHSLAK